MCAPIVCTEYRHRTKRDSVHRRHEKIFNFVESVSARNELMQVSQKLNDSDEGSRKTGSLEKDRECLVK